MRDQIRIIQVPSAIDSIATGCFIAGIACFTLTGSVQVLLGIGLAYGAYSLGLRFFLSECYAMVVKDDPITIPWLQSIGFANDTGDDLVLGKLVIHITRTGQMAYFVQDDVGCDEQLLGRLIPRTKAELVSLANYLDVPIHAPHAKRRRYFL